jgi:hypothetical protein
MKEACAICGCELLRMKGVYASSTVDGRRHASKHHFVPERFFGRSANRRNTTRERIFKKCPWGREGEYTTLCYDCHELLIHNPVLSPEDMEDFAKLVRERGFSEKQKESSYRKLTGRVLLFNEVIHRGLAALSEDAQGEN